jgi:hypothetical protein
MIQIYRIHRFLFRLFDYLTYLMHRSAVLIESRVWYRNIVTILASIVVLTMADMMFAFLMMVPVTLTGIARELTWLLLNVMARIYPHHPVSGIVFDGNHVEEV